MKLKVVYSLIFAISILLMVFYASKKLVLYDKSAIEEVKKFSGIENGVSTTYSSPQKVTRTYQDNYASIGGAIGFGIVAAASLLAFAIAVKNEKS